VVRMRDTQRYASVSVPSVKSVKGEPGVEH